MPDFQELYNSFTKSWNALAKDSAALGFLDRISLLAVIPARESYLGKLFWYKDYHHLWQGSLLCQATKLVAGRVQELSAGTAGPLNGCLENSFFYQKALSMEEAGRKLVFSREGMAAQSRFCRLAAWLFNLGEQER